jgi:hypothetical protein
MLAAVKKCHAYYSGFVRDVSSYSLVLKEQARSLQTTHCKYAMIERVIARLPL